MVVRSLPGLELAGMFGTAQDAIEWTVRERGNWHFAFRAFLEEQVR